MRSLAWMIVLLFVAGCTQGDDRGRESASSTEGTEAIAVPPAGVGEPANPLQAEMRALTKVVQLAIVAVANDQLSLIPPAFAQLHGAREKTQSALEAGAFQLPQNADNVEGFVAMDDAFHEQLAGLLQAAKADDLAAASRQLGGLVQGCTSCHQSYRFP